MSRIRVSTEPERFCEFCHASLGRMSEEAYDAIHRHCDKVECVERCPYPEDDEDIAKALEEENAFESEMLEDQ